MDSVAADTVMKIKMKFIKLDGDDILFQGIACYIFDKNTKEEKDKFADDDCAYSFNRKKKLWKYLNLNDIDGNKIFNIDDIKSKGTILGAFNPVVINENEMLEAIINEEVNL